VFIIILTSQFSSNTMFSSDSNEVESMLSWTSEERRSDQPVRPADSTGSSWPDDQAESILDMDEASSTWSGVERFSDNAQVESDFQELVDHDSVSTKSSDKQHGSLEKEFVACLNSSIKHLLTTTIN
jgi:hypothetical protein